MVSRIALLRSAAQCGPGLCSALHPPTPFRRPATATATSILRSAPARRAHISRGVARVPRKAPRNTRCYSREAIVPVIRGNIDRETGRPRPRTTSSSSSSSSFSRRRRWPRHPKFLRASPNKTLSLRLKSRSQPLEFETWKRVDRAAGSKSMRLPIVALQHMIRQDERVLKTSLSDSLCSEDELRRRVSALAYKGITQDDVRTWTWILAVDNPDERAARFLSPDLAGSSRPKPIFMLLQMLQRENVFLKGKTLAGLYRYIAEHHVRARTASPLLPFGAVRRTLDSGLNMSPQTFVLTMHMLVHHYLRLWPSAVTAVAKLMSDYIKTIPNMAQIAAKKRARDDEGQAEADAGAQEAGAQSVRDRKVFADMCYVFNAGLQLFRQRAPVEPILNMRYNWRAQRVLLATSTSPEMPRPLLINRAGFRSIRRVLLALGKSPAERRVSMRMARTWPPYRRDWDGLDEQRQPKDDFSRSVQAGVMMHEAGYGDTDHERALNVLGGVVPGQWPTVHTRTLGPHIWPGRKANLNQFSEWAARVRATRDVNEAWRQFNSGPGDVKPSVFVYAEMFMKLYAAPVGRHHPAQSESSTATWPHGKELLPGDAREVYPVFDAALTPFERARISPPTAHQLYNQMLAEGTRPAGKCLVVLVDNAAKLGEAKRYLHDSGMDERALGALRLPDTFTASPLSRPSPVIPPCQHKSYEDFFPPGSGKSGSLPHAALSDRLREIPLAVFNAYIGVLCRLQPTLSYTPAGPMKRLRTQLIHHAIWLTMLRLPPADVTGRAYLAPYHHILQRLSAPQLLMGPEHTNDQLLHDQEALALSLELYAYLRKIGAGTDDTVFRSIVRATLVYSNNLDSYVPDKAVAVPLSWPEQEWDGETAAGDTAMPPASGDSSPELLAKAHATIVEIFNGFIADGAGTHEPEHSATRNSIKAYTLDIYLKLLAFLRDAESMAAALRWVVRVYDDPVLLEDAKDVDHSQHSAMQRCLILYRIVAEASNDRQDAAHMAELAQQFSDLRARGSTWHWPTSEEADAFVRWHRNDKFNKEFWRRIRQVD